MFKIYEMPLLSNTFFTPNVVVAWYYFANVQASIVQTMVHMYSIEIIQFRTHTYVYNRPVTLSQYVEGATTSKFLVIFRILDLDKIIAQQ